jgi:amino-acid N-acetyltransferase
MDLQYELIDDPNKFEAFKALLKSSDLPHEDLDYKKDLLVGYYENDTLVGTGGLEIYGPYALLRSLSVRMGLRGKSVGSTITEFLLEQAKKKGLSSIYLLTETAPGFFLKKGFTTIQREEVPAEVKRSSEFSHVCPVSASVMMLKLQ